MLPEPRRPGASLIALIVFARLLVADVGVLTGLAVSSLIRRGHHAAAGALVVALFMALVLADRRSRGL